MNQEDLKQIETLVRVGCAALQQSKPLEESQQIGATTLQLIETLRAVVTPPADTPTAE
jgi:hypothetical protein